MVGSWPGVSVQPHRFAGVEFCYGGQELGHVHSDGWADLPFPRQVRNRLVADGKAKAHRVLPDTGWVSHPILDAHDEDEVIALFQMSYQRALAAARRRPKTRN